MGNHQQPGWDEQLKKPPFQNEHFTDEMRTAVLQVARARSERKRYRMKPLAYMAAAIVIALGIGMIFHSSVVKRPTRVAAGTENQWKPADIFKVNGHELVGKNGKIGIEKLNKAEGEPLFSSKGGVHCQIYFWGKPESLTGKYKLTATSKESKETIPLYEWPIELAGNEIGADGVSGAKFSIPKPGLWKLDVYVNEVHFEQFVIDVK